MRLALTALVLVATLATQASGVVDTSASTSSFLVSSGSELAAARTISESSLSSPEMYYSSNGQIDSHVAQPGGGEAIISHNVYTTYHNYYGALGGTVFFSNKMTATNSMGSDLIMTGTATGEVCYSQEYAMVKSEAFGMGIANVGEGECSFDVDGEQKAVSTRMPTPVPVLIFPNDYSDKELVVTFKQKSLDIEEPLEILHEEVDFSYNTINNQLSRYNYDFSSFLSSEDTSCNSYMSLYRLN